MITPAPSAADLLREARTKARLSQAELGHVAGVSQSVISAYESGHRQPSLPVLTRLIQATGSDLRMAVLAQEPQPRREPGPLGRRVRAHRHELRAAAANHGVSNLQIFGSVARGDEDADSDVDILVDLPEEAGLFALARLRRDLEDILGSAVDLVPSGDLKDGVAANVARDVMAL